MFKRRHFNGSIVGQQLSGDDLSTVFGGQSREADDVDRQLDKTGRALRDALAPIFHPINETVRLIGLTERLVQRSLDHDARWAITDQEAAQLRERLSEAEAEDPLGDAETDEAEVADWLTGSAAGNAAAHAFHGQQSAAAAGSHNPSPSPNTPNTGPGAGGQSSSSGGPYR